MDKQVNKYLNHAFKASECKIIAGNGIEDIFRELKNRCVCPKCEGVAFRDKGYMKNKTSTCPKCGWSGSAVTIDEYVTFKMYK